MASSPMEEICRQRVHCVFSTGVLCSVNSAVAPLAAGLTMFWPNPCRLKVTAQKPLLTVIASVLLLNDLLTRLGRAAARRSASARRWGRDDDPAVLHELAPGRSCRRRGADRDEQPFLDRLGEREAQVGIQGVDLRLRSTR